MWYQFRAELVTNAVVQVSSLTWKPCTFVQCTLLSSLVKWSLCLLLAGALIVFSLCMYQWKALTILGFSFLSLSPWYLPPPRHGCYLAVLWMAFLFVFWGKVTQRTLRGSDNAEAGACIESRLWEVAPAAPWDKVGSCHCAGVSSFPSTRWWGRVGIFRTVTNRICVMIVR